MKLLKHNGNIALFGGGQYVLPNIHIIELEVDGEYFANSPTNQGGRGFTFRGVGTTNKMYIDFNDGTGVKEFTRGVNADNNSNIYTYQDGYTGRRKIKIWFDKPENIYSVTFQNFRIYGMFPKSFSNYNITSYRFSGVLIRWESFPSDFRALKANTIEFIRCFTSKLNSVPVWVKNSTITNLVFQGVFNLSDVSTSGVEDFILINNLEYLCLSEANLTPTSLPSNLKDFPNLKTLNLGNNVTLASIPSVLQDCANIENLIFGNASGMGYSYLTSWGSGLGGMFNLKTLELMTADNFLPPTTVVTGLENCTNLKKLSLQGAYNTIVRIDEFVNNFYNFTITNNPFTGFTLEIGWRTSTIRNSRPTGVYQQPIDYIDDSNFGTPTTPMEQIWVLVNVFGHTISITNTAGNGSEILTP